MGKCQAEKCKWALFGFCFNIYQMACFHIRGYYWYSVHCETLILNEEKYRIFQGYSTGATHYLYDIDCLQEGSACRQCNI